MGCTSTKRSKAEGDIDRYHLEILNAAQGDDVRRLKEILDELDKRKATTTKKEVLNMVVFIQFKLPSSDVLFIPISSSPPSSFVPTLSMKSMNNFSTQWTEKVLSESIPLNEYPRPHLKRKLWLNLNGIWSFTITSINETFPKIYDQFIRVPFPVESYLSGIQKRIDSTMFLWYKRKFNIQHLHINEQYRIILHFDKVDYETIVYINNRLIGLKHLGGYEPFSYDITSYLNHTHDNEIIVRVWDPTNQWYQARGKQMLDIDEPKSILYTPCSGIWGTVWLERVPNVYINRLQFKTKISSKQIHFIYRIDLFLPTLHSKYELIDLKKTKQRLLNVPYDEILNKSEANYEYKLEIIISKQNFEHLITLTTNKSNQDNEFIFPLSDINLWSPENPYLYNIRIHLYKSYTFIEEISSYIGFRQISLCLNPKNICLNNKPYFMYGVLDQGYWPDGLYRAPTDEAYKYDIKQMKLLGFNTLRKHMKTETSRWYYWCDVLGMLVWQDMPAGDSFEGYEIELEHDKQLRLHRDNRTNNLPLPTLVNENINPRTKLIRRYKSKLQFEYELKAIIDFLSFHPSIVVWVLFNEEWGQYNTIRLGEWLQHYDSERLINAASGWQDRTGIGHMRDIHDYTKNIFLPAIDDQDRALVLGECGGFGLTDSGWSYNTYSDSYLLTYAFEQLILNLSTRLSAMIYTQLSDVENEKNGIFNYNRTILKFLPNRINQVLNKNFSQLYKLEHLWNLTSIPYTNYTDLSLSTSFNFKINRNPLKFYFYICYLYSFVNITIDKHYKISLNNTDEINDYHYISLPNNLFSNSLNQKHSLDIYLSYNNNDQSFLYINRTYFYLNLAILSE
ncbi:unnamed protein product [Adineta steineri]|uniref:Beta-galactosidase n=1 Tax=Adineta steineri TaxID=433720 RepID=A0A813VG79_9BILA|nr:unnamed protein product [Adineta steineri]CAF0976872.1 unnamed protein product [Adineta steineri]